MAVEMRLVLFGAPGAGKGTQAQRLVAEFELLYLGTGDVLRSAIANATELGMQAKAFVDRGDLVPDDLVIGIVKDALRNERAERGFILDGFPRTIHQAEALDEFLYNGYLDLTRVISLEVNEEELVQRILARSGSSETQRTDDNEAVIRSRFKAFLEQTMPLKRFYQARGLISDVDGMGTVDEVYEAVRSAALGR